MKKALAVFSLVLVLMTSINGEEPAVGQVAAPRVFPAVPKYLFEATSRIRVSSPSRGKQGFGSGVALDLSRYGLNGKNWMLTAAHVVTDERGKVEEEIEVEVVKSQHKSRVWAKAKVVAMDVERDVALIYVDVEFDKLAKLAAGDNLDIGDAIAAVGSPAGTAVTVTFGFLTAKTTEIYGRKEGDDWQGSMTIFGGNSGGPVYDVNREEVVGIAVAGIATNGFAAHIAFFVPITTIHDFIEKNMEKAVEVQAKEQKRNR
jgi:S1-C subfamily serine protease